MDRAPASGGADRPAALGTSGTVSGHGISVADPSIHVVETGRRDSPRRALLLYALVLLVLFFDVLFLGRTLDPYPFVPGIEGPPAEAAKAGPCFCNDAGAVVWAFESWNLLVHHELFQEGEIPLWDPYQATGVPLAANFQSGVFSPMQWPFFMSTSHRWWDYLFVLRLMLAGMFSFLFLRRIGLDFVPSWFGGLAYMLSGYLVDYINTNHVAIPLLLPAAFYFVESWRVERRPAHFLGTVLTLALMVLAGMPEETVLAGLLIGFFLLFQLVGERPPWREWLSWGWILILVLALSGVLLIPGFEYLSLASSKHFLRDWGAGRFAPGAIVTFLVPFFFGAPGTLGWQANFAKSFNVPSALGVVPLILAVLGFVSSHHRLRWFFGSSALLVVAKLFGPAPIQELGHLPVLNWVIFTKYLQPTFAFCVAVLAALGLSALFERRARSGTILISLGILMSSAIVGWLFHYWSPIIHYSRREVVVSVLLCASFGIVMGLLAAGLGGLHRKGYGHAATAIFLLATIEIVALGIRIHPTRRPSGQPIDFVETLRNLGTRFRSMGDLPLFPNTASAARIPDLRVLDPILPRRMAQAFSSLTKAPLMSRLTYREFDDYESPALDLLGVRYVTSSQDIRNLLFRQRPWTESCAIRTEDRTGSAISLLQVEPHSESAFNLPSRCTGLSVLVDTSDETTLQLLGPGGILQAWTVPRGFHSLGLVPTGSLPPRSRMELRTDSNDAPYLAVTPHLAADAVRLVPLGQRTDAVRIFVRPSALPIAFLTDSPRLLDPVATPRQIPGFDLEASKDHRESSGSLRGLERTSSTDQDVLLLSRTSNRLEFEIHSDEPSHLFLSVTHYPGWSAEVNGAPVRLQRAAFFMTALPVPAGSSHVVLRFAPRSVKMGLALTVLGLFLTAWSAGRLAAEPGSKPPVTRAGI